MNLAVWLLAAFIDWALIVGAVAVVALDCRWLPGAWLVIGNRQHALAVLQHEAVHGNLCQTRWLNDWIARLFAAWPIGVQLEGYRVFHLDHHARLNERTDPEIVFKEAHPCYFAPRSKLRIAGDLLSDFAFWNLNEMRTFYGMIGGTCEIVGIAFLWIQAAILTTWFGLWWVVPLWAASFLSVAWAHNRLRIWLEHSGAPAVDTWRIRLWKPLDWVLRPHNIGLHWEHHLHPKVAWWRLRPAT